MTPLVEEHETIASTQARALELAAEGAPPWTVVLAIEQTAGVGRIGHAWVSPPGGLWCSIIAPAIRAEGPVLAPSIVAALTARVSIRLVTGLETRLKWPNDILVGRRKLGGIIAAERNERLVLGIGINVSNDLAWLPPEVAAGATTIRRETGRDFQRRDLLGSIVGLLPGKLGAAARRELDDEAWDALIREHPVRWRASTTTPWIEGKVAGLEPTGALRIAAPDRTHVAATGDLEILWPETM